MFLDNGLGTLFGCFARLVWELLGIPNPLLNQWATKKMRAAIAAAVLSTALAEST